MMRTLLRAVGAAIAICTPLLAGAQTGLPSYRARLLGVYTSDGDPIEGAEVSDALTKTTALTTKTGTVTLSFLPDGATLVRIRKVGFVAATMLVNIDPTDTLPVMVMLKPMVRELPAVITKDSAPRYVSPGLRAFEERRAAGGGYFVVEKEIRKWDAGPMTNVIRNIPAIKIICERGKGMASMPCHASTRRAGGKHAIMDGDCPVDVYMDGTLYYSSFNFGGFESDADLQKLQATNFAAVEFYPGGASIPAQYNKTGASCGVLLLWTRER
jgi:hypothetical protein